MGAKAKEMIFCGYAACSKGFHFWDPFFCDIILSRDARFDEQRFGLDGLSTSSSQDDPFPTFELDSFVLPSPQVTFSTPPTTTQVFPLLLHILPLFHHHPLHPLSLW